jgi:DNA adenine methylase
VAAVWSTILSDDAEWLCEKITHLRVDKQSVDKILAAEPDSTRVQAFQTIVRNRVQRGGILSRTAGLMKLGERGRGLTSRWYPETLARRIMDIFARRAYISFRQEDGMCVLTRSKPKVETAFFIDPPYTKAARRLYSYSSIDHRNLFDLAGRLRSPFLISYDESEEITHLATSHQFSIARIPMRSAHHKQKNELLIGRRLAWMPIASQSDMRSPSIDSSSDSSSSSPADIT